MAISLHEVAVRYRVPREPVSGIKEYAIRLLKRQLSYDEFWALQGITIQVRKGEVFGVIGSNGSGKSTLLKVIARVLFPTRGRVILAGSVAPLLELGAGFHQELTGMENIYLNSALLGRSRAEVDRLLPEIIDFAEIGDFINAPIRTYSTGMAARLGFAVATCARPDILLVDEVLSVGDARFARKCLDRMYNFREQGTTILIVSHSMSTIETFCERALWLNRGAPVAYGSVGQVIEQYIASNSSGGDVSPPPTLSLTSAYTSLGSAPAVIPAQGLLDVHSGSLSVWLKIPPDRPVRECTLIHTDDSRYILYIGSYSSEQLKRELNIIIARAGGNLRALDTFYGTTSFPEVSATIHADADGPGFALASDQWHQVVMTWNGYPEGVLRLYLDGGLLGRQSYDHRYDDGRALPHSIAIGHRPADWTGELVEQSDGSLKEMRPISSMEVEGSGLQVGEMGLYAYALTEEEVQEIYTTRSERA